MPDPSQPHDKLFKGLLDQPGAAAALIRERLPAEVVALLSDDPPEPVAGEFVDEALRGSQSDRLFLARLKTGGALLLYFLIDHKSSPGANTLLQLLGYMVRIWVRHAGDRADALRTLPPILPVVVYHGAEPWTVSLSLRDTIAAPEIIKRHQPDFRYHLVDLGPIPDPDLSAWPPLRAGLLALKYSHREGDSETVLIQAFTDAQDLPTLFSMLVVYTTTVYRDVTPSSLRRVIRQVKPEWEDEMLSIAAKEWMAEGEAKGEAKGEARGRAAMLLRQFHRKFGDVPVKVADRVRTAGVDQLDDWSERFVDAESLDEVFRP